MGVRHTLVYTAFFASIFEATHVRTKVCVQRVGPEIVVELIRARGSRERGRYRMQADAASKWMLSVCLTVRTSTAVRSHGVQGSSFVQLVPWAAVQSLLLFTYRSTWIDQPSGRRNHTDTHHSLAGSSVRQ